MLTRRGLDWTAKYRDLADAAKSLSMQNAIIDGGRSDDARLSDFAALRKAITKRQHDLSSPFDLPHLNGHDLRDMPLEDRREILASMIPPDIRIQFSQALPVEDKSIFHLVDQAGLQGMVSKRKDSKYRGGPSTNWCDEGGSACICRTSTAHCVPYRCPFSPCSKLLATLVCKTPSHLRQRTRRTSLPNSTAPRALVRL
ncbi:hypothetical protein ACFX5Q_13100 [Mesorhizobium sp. IMUNJ 23033]|uniref:ATP-dependent DNA ligase n=1 Tax=Mesorhizobium sp. IMUNJ 23033 TaxID=3378039 RepID=UPI00384BB5D4